MKRVILVTLCVICLGVTAFTQTEKQSKVPDYSTTPRSEVPQEFKWNSADIFATNDEWKATLDTLRAELPQLNELSKHWTESAAGALAYLRFHDDWNQRYLRVLYYPNLENDMDLSDATFTNMMGEARSLGVEIGVLESGFEDQVHALGAEKFEEYVKAEPALEEWAFGIREIFRGKAHRLSEEQQRVVSLAGLTTDIPSQVFAVLNDSDIPHPEVTLTNGEKVLLTNAAFTRVMMSKNPEDRRLAAQTYYDNKNRYTNTLAVAMDGGAKGHLFNARVRNFNTCLEAALFGDNIDTEVYFNTMKQVRAHAGLLQRYAKIKKEILGLETMRLEDITMGILPDQDKEFSWEEGRDMVMASLAPLGPEVQAVLTRAFEERWIDRYPNKSKASGAYSGMVYGVHPFIKLNYTGQYSDVVAMAHELGHTIHSQLSAENQPFATYDYPSYITEVASTLNEHMLMLYLMKTDSDPMFRLYMLDEYMKRNRTLTYFAIMMTEIEAEMHELVEKGGSITADWMNAKMLEKLRFYYGHDEGICEVADHYKSQWTNYPHLFLNFYLINYCNGWIASMAVSEMVLESEEARDAYIAYLKSGGSDYPLNLLKVAGVDLASKDPFELAFRRTDKLLTEMEELVKKLKEEGEL